MTDREGPEVSATPTVWVIGAYRAGEHNQLLALAEALAEPFVIKWVRHRWQGGLFNLFRGTGLFGINTEDRAQFVAPWPRVVIAAGMKNEPVCRWIRQASGGFTRIVHIGRPWVDPEHIDLVITTPQYRLPDRSNVLQNALTLHRVTNQRLDTELARHAQRWERLPTPRIAVFIGGDSGPYAFGKRAALRLASEADALARSHGASLLISTSARTPRVVARTLRQQLTVPFELYEWRANDAENPFFAYLGAADRLIVSFDSISMLSEACATGRPVYMFDLANVHRDGQTIADADQNLRAFGYQLLMRLGPQRLSRDIGLVHAALLEAGRAVWLGEDLNAVRPHDATDLDVAVARVKALL